MTVFLSRMRLSRAPAIKALDALLLPECDARKADANHRLIWSAFADTPERTRDFLWREEGDGAYTVLSRRAPDHSPFFDPPQTKTYEPDLRSGDYLNFVLRANATRTVKSEQAAQNGKPKRKHIDLVMDALYKVAPEKRADQRAEFAQKVAQTWLTAQGEQHGFDCQSCQVESYVTRALPTYQGRRKGQPQFGILDLHGTIEITDPNKFLDKLISGFGRARAFGCGLMLIRRANS